MSIQFKYAETTCTNEPFAEQVANANNPALPESVISKIVDEFHQVNKTAIMEGDVIYIPILGPFQKKYDSLLTADEIPTTKAEEPEVELEEVVEDIPEESTLEETPSEGEKRAVEEPTEITEENMSPVEEYGGLQVRLYPYTFTRPNETIEAVIRLYNDMNVSRAIINKLVYEFSNINTDSLPPKLGQTVQIPVLLPFCYRHENKHKIFTDE
jgi:hypothetical protein